MSKFDRFDIYATSYKRIQDHDIPVHILIPKTLTLTPNAQTPILVRIHGGYLITGAAMFPDFVPDWALNYCIQSNAIWVTPDYRLMPESTGLEILEDLDDFWSWVDKGLGGYLESVGRGGLVEGGGKNRVLVYGESAGGYLAIQSVLRRKGGVKAVIAAYPMLEVEAPWFSQKFDGKSPFGAPQIPEAVLISHLDELKQIRAGSKSGDLIVSSATPPARIPLALAILQQGVLTTMLGTDKYLFPLRVLEEIKQQEKMPFVFTFHGMNDRAVPHEGTEKFVRLWKEKFGEESIEGYFLEGDHGVDEHETLETEWLKAGLEKVTKAWLL